VTTTSKHTSPWLNIVKSKEHPNLDCVVWRGDEYLLEEFLPLGVEMKATYPAWDGVAPMSYFNIVLIKYQPTHDRAKLCLV
jgi:hypothetical protein